MPRHSRPPLTAREISAYLSGGRMYRRYHERVPGTSKLMVLLAHMGELDAKVLDAMGHDLYLYWFQRGWDDAENLTTTQ